MGNDMRTLGARLHLDPSVTETELVATARDTLLTTDLSRQVELDQLRDATTLEQLFAAFSMLVVRRDGAVVSTFGYDNRYTIPEDLLSAIAVAVTDDSWFAFTTDYAGTHLVTFRNGTAETQRNIGSVFFGPTTIWELPTDDLPPLCGDLNIDLPAVLSELSGHDLQPGFLPPTPRPDHQVLLEMLERGEPWQLAPTA